MATVYHATPPDPEPVQPCVRRATLDELLDHCKPEDRPDTVEFGPPVGSEMI